MATATNKSVKDTTINDVQDAVEDKVEDVRDAVVEKATNLSLNQKLALTAAAALAASVVVQKVLNRFRKPVVVQGDVYLVEGDAEVNSTEV